MPLQIMSLEYAAGLQAAAEAVIDVGRRPNLHTENTSEKEKLELSSMENSPNTKV